MTLTQDQFDDMFTAIVEGIFNSQVIPESHKQKYIDYIKRNGLTEKMLSEIKTIFKKEEEASELSIQEKESLLLDLEKVIEEEKQKTDRTQAEIVSSIEIHHEQSEKKGQEELQRIEKEAIGALEEIGKEGESEKIDDIREKLGLSH